MCLQDGQTLAGDMRLVNGAAARHDIAVHGNAFAREHTDGIRHAQLLDGYRLRSSVDDAIGFERLERHQPAQTVPRAVGRITFKRLPNGEEKDHRGRFQEFSQDLCADRGNGHQQIDIEFAIDAQRIDAALRNRLHGHCHRQDI